MEDIKTKFLRGLLSSGTINNIGWKEHWTANIIEDESQGYELAVFRIPKNSLGLTDFKGLTMIESYIQDIYKDKNPAPSYVFMTLERARAYASSGGSFPLLIQAYNVLINAGEISTTEVWNLNRNGVTRNGNLGVRGSDIYRFDAGLQEWIKRQ